MFSNREDAGWSEVKQAVIMVAEALDSMQVQFGICGGAAIGLIREQQNTKPRVTEDVDLVIQPDKSRYINAETISEKLLVEFPSQFQAIVRFGVRIPAACVTYGNTQVLVELEIFDVEAWPFRPQYNLNEKRNTRVKVPIGGEKTVYVFSPVWLLREKILTHSNRVGSGRAKSDLDDILFLLDIVGERSLVMKSGEEIAALKVLLEKAPQLKESLMEAVVCPEVLEN
jgi:hypothetical protein